jgi:hypothetical protein
VQVPPKLARRPYRLLMDLCVSQGGMIPLGLYRPRGCKGAPMPYVHLNPFPDETLLVSPLLSFVKRGTYMYVHT